MKKLIATLFISFLAVACSSHVGVRDRTGSLSALEPGSTFALLPQVPDSRLVEPLTSTEEQVIAAALTKSLTERGLRQADADTADYLVQYTAYKRDSCRIIFPEDFWTQEYYVIQTSSMTERRMNPKTGYLHVRIVDLQSGSIVWQGVAEKVTAASSMHTDGRLRKGVDMLLAGGSGY